MKKRITIITHLHRSGQYYARQIQELFGEFVEVHAFSTDKHSLRQITQADLYLISTDAFDEAEEARALMPLGGQIVEIQVTYQKEIIERLKQIPRDTSVLFVNATQQMAREAVTQLEQLGINHLHFIPYGPDCHARPVNGHPAMLESWDALSDNIQMAVTPDEADFVPARISTIINIGPRPCTAGTLIEIALRLDLANVLENREFQRYMKSLAPKNYSFDQIFLKSRKMERRFDILIELLDEGLIGVDESGDIFACNKKARTLTGIGNRLVIGQKGNRIFPLIPFDTCLIDQAPHPPRLIRIGNKNITLALNPVLKNGDSIGAFATLQEFTEQERRQNELRTQLLHKGYRAKYTFDDVIGNSVPIERTKALLKRMAATDSPVLLIGETGTGKELFAHAVHLASRRKNAPFVAINVAAMPENLLESELFGYEEGAFTGARKGGRPGLFEFAQNGTLFLDEVEGMSPAMQIKLLRVLQEGEIMRVGGNQIIRIDVRIITATNESLDEMVQSGVFRRDLYYRLNTFPVLIPPLRERGDDIFLLVEAFQRQLGRYFELTDAVHEILLHYAWPGNIRELRNVIEYLSFFGEKKVDIEHLPPTFQPLVSKSEAGTKAVIKTWMPSPDKPYGYWFVLGELYQASEDGRILGREPLLELAREQHLLLSQRDIRALLSQLQEDHLVKVGRGRSGSRITPEGRTVWETHSVGR